MYCSNCGTKLPKPKPHYCPHCGVAVQVHAREDAHAHAQNAHAPGHAPLPSTGRRIGMVLYVLAYLVLLAASAEAGIVIHQSQSSPDPQASFVTCRSGQRVSYKTVGIRNPLTDAGHDNIIIDVACRNLGGNTYSNVVRSGPKVSVWEYGLAVFGGGLILLELVKGTLVYLFCGYFPGVGTLGRR